MQVGGVMQVGGGMQVVIGMQVGGGMQEPNQLIINGITTASGPWRHGTVGKP